MDAATVGSLDGLLELGLADAEGVADGCEEGVAEGAIEGIIEGATDG